MSHTPTKHQGAALWSDVIRRVIVELRGLFSDIRSRLDEAAIDDMEHLLDAAQRLESMLGVSQDSAAAHDMMNVLAAMRGDAEMLLEDLGPAHQPIADALKRLLRAHHGRTLKTAVAPKQTLKDRNTCNNC